MPVTPTWPRACRCGLCRAQQLASAPWLPAAAATTACMAGPVAERLSAMAHDQRLGACPCRCARWPGTGWTAAVAAARTTRPWPPRCMPANWRRPWPGPGPAPQGARHVRLRLPPRPGATGAGDGTPRRPAAGAGLGRATAPARRPGRVVSMAGQPLALTAVTRRCRCRPCWPAGGPPGVPGPGLPLGIAGCVPGRPLPPGLPRASPVPCAPSVRRERCHGGRAGRAVCSGNLFPITGDTLP